MRAIARAHVRSRAHIHINTVIETNKDFHQLYIADKKQQQIPKDYRFIIHMTMLLPFSKSINTIKQVEWSYLSLFI